MQVVVDMSDMKLSKNAEDILVTYSLGSCIGITLYDPVVMVGGILHFMLPDSSIDIEKSRNNPFIYADTGIPKFFRTAYKLGAKKRRMKVVVAGGANILDFKNFFRIGEKNYKAAKTLFEKNRLSIDYQDVGGQINRTMTLFMNTGSTIIRTPGRNEKNV
jgi:chemotaxis protein CheD